MKAEKAEIEPVCDLQGLFFLVWLSDVNTKTLVTCICVVYIITNSTVSTVTIQSMIIMFTFIIKIWPKYIWDETEFLFFVFLNVCGHKKWRKSDSNGIM